MARRVYAVATVLVAMLQSSSMEGCECTEWSYEDPVAAILGGIVCGNRYRPPNDAPAASFTMTPNPVRSGELATFDASASKDPDSKVLTYEWDLDPTRFDGPDGGPWEVTTREPKITRRVTTVYPEHEDRVVTLRVSDGRDHAVSTRGLRIEGLPLPPPPGAPSASFTVTPNPGFAGESVHFDASASRDPEGGALTYEWDFEGNGEYTVPRADPTATKVYRTTGSRDAGLRVTDPAGTTGTATQSVTINPIGTASASGARGARFTARLRGKTPHGGLGTLARRGPRAILRGLVLRGRLRGRVRGGGPQLAGFLASRWTARLTLTANARTRSARIKGIAHARFAGKDAGRGCLRFRLRRRPGRAPSGRFRLTGGTGAGARLRATGSLVFHPTERTLRGRVLASRAAGPRPLPRACRRLR